MSKDDTPKFEFPKFENPFFATDILKSFELGKLLGEFKLPGVGAGALVETQKKNLETLVQANKLAAEGVQALATRQAEIVRSTLDGFANAVRESVTGASPDSFAQHQAEFVRSQFEQAIANLKDLAELSAKSNAKVVDLLSTRFKEAMEEIKSGGK